MKRHFSAAAAMAVVCVGASAGWAAILPPGATLMPVPAVAPPAVYITEAIGTYNVPGHFSGTVTVSVYQESLAVNPLGGLTFVYSVTNNANSPNSVQRISTDDYTGVTVDAGYFGATFLPPLTNPLLPMSGAPDYADRSVSGNVPGFAWLSPNGLLPGQASPLLILRTNAPTSTTDTVNVIDGATYIVSGLLGPAPIPEPASLGLLGLGALVLLRGRRR